MSYKCGICRGHVDHGTMRRHIVKRADGQIHREIPVCEDCSVGLRRGYSLEQMILKVGPVVEISDLVSKLSVPAMSAPRTTTVTKAPPVKIPVFIKR